MNIARNRWLDFAEGACGLGRGQAGEAIDAMLARQGEAEGVIARERAAEPGWKERYRRWLRKRTPSARGEGAELGIGGGG